MKASIQYDCSQMELNKEHREVDFPTDNKLSSGAIQAILVHDLKGPVGNMIVLLNMILDGKSNIDKEALFLLLHDLRQAAVSAQGLLENYITWLKIEDFNFEIKPVNVELNRIIDENLLLLAPIANHKGISIFRSLPDICYVWADEYLLNIVIRNLIHNALKFTKINGEIILRTANQDRFVRFDIEDNGIGMTESELSNLFDPEKHNSSKGTEQEPGSGIGLMLVKEFVEQNGGTISVRSEKNNGATFSFTVHAGKS
ncbi:MAG: HAMP domain-containing histidine kinase [Bacteroidales bacterium]|nr:HAMP domain-containing histidine kinase [Bacteroidales bacterium]